MYFEDNDFDYEEDENDLKEFTIDIINEIEYDIKIEIITFYKNLLMKEPEFIGIKNISCGEILNIIETTCDESISINKININKFFYELNSVQNDLFINMYDELNIIGNNDIFNRVTNKIFKKIYV